jgi:hypothetical protein
MPTCAPILNMDDRSYRDVGSMWMQCALLLVLLITVPLCLAAADREPIEYCGLGPTPGAADFQSINDARQLQRERLGYDLVCEDMVRSMEDEVEAARAYAHILPALGFTPIDLSGTPFATYRLLGATSGLFSDGKAASIHRYFQAPGSELVDLFEWDLSLGGAVYVDPVRQTAQIGERHGQLTVLQSRTGRALSTLSWSQNNRRIELRVNRNAATSRSRDALIRLAESLPPAVPARADGVPRPRPSDWPPPLPWPLPEKVPAPPIPEGLVPADTK